jgi:hypothetical protein
VRGLLLLGMVVLITGCGSSAPAIVTPSATQDVPRFTPEQVYAAAVAAKNVKNFQNLTFNPIACLPAEVRYVRGGIWSCRSPWIFNDRTGEFSVDTDPYHQ